MVDYGGLAILVIGGYILIKYGPQIAAGLQQQAAAAQQPQATPDTTAAAAPTTPITINMPAAAPAPTNAGNCGPGTVFDAASNQCITDAGAQAVNKTLQIFRQQACAPGQQLLLINNTWQCVADTQNFTTGPPAPPTACVNNTQDPACGFSGHPKCCPGQTLLGTPLQTVAGKGPAVSTRTPKKTTTRSATATTNPNNALCGVNPCGGSALVPTPGKCFKAGTTTLIPCNQGASKAAVAYANVGQASRSYLTQVVNGQRRTTIDPYMPAGWYLSQSDYRSSLREPALH